MCISFINMSMITIKKFFLKLIATIHFTVEESFVLMSLSIIHKSSQKKLKFKSNVNIFLLLLPEP